MISPVHLETNRVVASRFAFETVEQTSHGSFRQFRSYQHNGEIMVAMYGLFSRLFLKSLAKSPPRMKGAARRGTCLGRQSLGFTRRQRLDRFGTHWWGQTKADL